MDNGVDMKKPEFRLFFGGFFLIVMVFAATDVLAERMAVIKSIANVRSGPGTDHAVIWKVEKYHPINVTTVSGKWYQFKDFENDIGWIHKSLVKKISTVITKKDRCNVREGPGEKHDVIFIVDRGIPFKVEKRQGNWIRIQHADGDAGWIHRSLVW
jgi:SH3-like domain-containing protein